MASPDNVISSSTSSSDGITRTGGGVVLGGDSAGRGMETVGGDDSSSGWHYSNGFHIQQPLLPGPPAYPLYYLVGDHITDTDSDADESVPPLLMEGGDSDYYYLGDVNNSGSDDESHPRLVDGNRHGSGSDSGSVDIMMPLVDVVGHHHCEVVAKQRQLWLPDQASPSCIRQISTYRYQFVDFGWVCTQETTGTIVLLAS